MVLSDRTLRERLAAGSIVVTPFEPDHVQPASIDLRLDERFLVFDAARGAAIDLADPPAELMREVKASDADPFVLHPGQFALGATLESVGVPDDLVGRLEGKSSLGRLGLLIHSTAGFIDPGFAGQITLELGNVAALPLVLRPGMRIGQISFLQMTSAAERPYGSTGLGSHYQGQSGPTRSALLPRR